MNNGRNGGTSSIGSYVTDAGEKGANASKCFSNWFIDLPPLIKIPLSAIGWGWDFLVNSKTALRFILCNRYIAKEAYKWDLDLVAVAEDLAEAGS